MNLLKKAYLISLFLGCFCPVLLAAEPPVQEAASQLTSQAETFRREKEKTILSLQEKPQIVVEKEKEMSAETAGETFFVKNIRVEGNTLIPEPLFEKERQQCENRNVSVSDLKAFAKIITNLYYSKGYLTSRAFLPLQKIENGEVAIRCIEGKVDRILVEQNRYFKSSLYTKAIHLPKNKIFRYEDLENSLYYLNQMRDRKAKSYIVASETPGASDIVLKADETYPIHVWYEYNNRGTKLTHKGRHNTNFENNNLTGNGDTLNAGFSAGAEGAFDAGSLSYSYPILSTATTLELGGSYVKSKLIGHLKPSEIKGRYWSISPGINQSIIKKPGQELSAFVGFEIKDSHTYVDDSKVVSDGMRVLKAGPRYSVEDGSGKTILSSDVHWGIPNFMGGSEENDALASRPHSGGDFVYFTGSLARLQRLFKSNYAIFRANGQWSDDPLTSVEQYRIGGAYSVRGYPESEASGDYGYNASAEFYTPIPFVPKNWQVPFTKKNWRDVTRLVGFIDVGKAYSHERASAESIKDKFLLGIGFGIRFDVTQYNSLSLDFGFPLGDDSSDDKDQMQIYMSFRGGF